MSDLVGNPEDRFSRVEAHMQFNYLCFCDHQLNFLFILFFLISLVRFSFFFFENLEQNVQSIVSLTISLRHKFVMQISAKVTNTLLFFVEKM